MVLPDPADGVITFTTEVEDVFFNMNNQKPNCVTVNVSEFANEPDPDDPNAPSDGGVDYEQCPGSKVVNLASA